MADLNVLFLIKTLYLLKKKKKMYLFLSLFSSEGIRASGWQRWAELIAKPKISTNFCLTCQHLHTKSGKPALCTETQLQPRLLTKHVLLEFRLHKCTLPIMALLSFFRIKDDQ